MRPRGARHQLTMSLVTAGLITACTHLQPPEEVQIPAPVHPPRGVTETEPTPAPDGSLWVQGFGQSPWTDLVARSLHDIIFVDVVESTHAISTADTLTSRATSAPPWPASPAPSNR